MGSGEQIKSELLHYGDPAIRTQFEYRYVYSIAIGPHETRA